MQTALIIEDEYPAARRLSNLLKQCAPECEILATIDSVRVAVRWLSENPAPEVIFMDIQLADGISFDIFSKVKIEVPVIFTTAYDEYALKAFKVNSIDYLLKPIEKEELEQAIQKYQRLVKRTVSYNQQTFDQMLEVLTGKKYKERFLIKIGQQLIQVPVVDVAYFYAEDRMVFAQCHHQKRHVIDYTLDQLEELTNPDHFFRINRKTLIFHGAIQKIQSYVNSRLILKLNPLAGQETIVSRERVVAFKEWLDR